MLSPRLGHFIIFLQAGLGHLHPLREGCLELSLQVGAVVGLGLQADGQLGVGQLDALQLPLNILQLRSRKVEKCF